MKYKFERPLAITMWDFSWLERRWPGAGYEDWNKVLDELIERGYDAVRIDVYPHLLAEDPTGEWELLPVWNQQIWGSPAINRVSNIEGNLIEFMRLCKQKNIKVALSTWFREDKDNIRMNINTPEKHGHIWKDTLDILNKADLLDVVLYVDLCNEFINPTWAPFVSAALSKETVWRVQEEGINWMKNSIEYVREFYPTLDYCYSFSDELETWEKQDVSYMDLLEPHVWMVQFSDFYEKVGYGFEKFDSTGYDNLVEKGEKLYLEKPEYWKNSLKNGIEQMASWSRQSGKPLITTECWSIVDAKDWPLLNWGWIKELCQYGVEEALKTGRWVSMATSNFCGPQFIEMWRDVEWHKNLTDLIHQGDISAFEEID